MGVTIRLFASGIALDVTFAKERDHDVAIVTANDPEWAVLASCLTMAWKLVPDQLLESLVDYRDVTFGEFFTFSYNLGPDRDRLLAEGVHVREDEDEILLTELAFREIVVKLARLHLEKAAPAHVRWRDRLSPAAQALMA